MSLTDVRSQNAVDTIEGIEESVIIKYFATINQEKFQQTASLFVQTGELLAPFTKPIVGPEAIASYLAKEAIGMKLLPVKGIYHPMVNGLQPIEVVGKVQTALFIVNVAWHFSLNKQQKIAIAKIKLLASPQELLGLKEIQDK